jgi:hypothetical protein
MRTRLRHAVLVLALAVSSAACAGGTQRAEPANPAGTGTVAAQTQTPTPTPRPAPEPTTPGEFLDSARKAMAAQNGWTFAVTGKEDLTAQGQTSAASYRATVQLTQRPEALHSQGVSVSKGKDRSEEIFVDGNTVHLKQAGQAWRHGSLSDPEMQSKVEDPLTDLETFRAYLNDPAGGVTLARSAGKAELRVRVTSTKFSAVKNRRLMEKVRAELAGTVEQLRKAGVPVNEQQLTLASLQETLTLDPVTHRIMSHRFQLRVLIPYGQQNMTYSQDVQEDSRGVFAGDIRLPANAK